MAGNDFADPVQGYSQYIDVNSFIDFFIANEVSKNVDGYRLSTYLHKQRDSDGGKLRMGPIWDFNLGFGNANYCTQGNPEGWVTSFNSICPQDFWLIPFWWNRLNQDGHYRSELAARWVSIRLNEFATSKIITYIDSVYNVLNTVLPGETKSAQQRNFETWPVLGQYVWPNYYVGSSFNDEVNWLKNWVTNRMNWLDLNMPSVITEISDVTEGVSVDAFPNPFLKEITFDYSLASAGAIEIKLFDLLGQLVLKTRASHEGAGAYQVTLKTEALPTGSYYYQVTSGTDLIAGKIIKWE
ncbi:MAG: CotH kinase family protein [Cytophagales bacterium]|nr:CotH kinase family protein [Cytophagales bacterium]